MPGRRGRALCWPVDRRTFVLGTLGLALGGDAVANARFRAGDPRLRELARRVDGPVISRSSAAYATARVSFNERYDGVRPLAILRAAGTGCEIELRAEGPQAEAALDALAELVQRKFDED